MNHAQAIDYWFSFVNYEHKTPLPDDLRLEGMQRLLEALGNPHERLSIVHVAGSKGKGSVSATLATILQKAGYRTGLFTSPHLVRPEERVQIDGEPISPEQLVLRLSEIREAIDKCRLQPTFFEIATALGFLHFHRQAVDMAVVEVGLGGRVDSTNVCMPEVAVVTSISLDHVKQLGNSLEEIARHKAGIFKQGRPAISGVSDPAVSAIIAEVAHERQAPLRQLNRDFRYRHESARIRESGSAEVTERRASVQVTTWNREWPWMDLHLMGEHQAANASVVLATVEILSERGWQIDDASVVAGLGRRWPFVEIVGRSG